MYKKFNVFRYVWDTYAFRKSFLVMKLSFILTVMLMQVAAASRAQNVSLTTKNTLLKDVFKTIHKQTGFDFVYDTDVLSKAGPVTVSFTNAPLKTVLDACFREQPIVYALEENTVIVTAKPRPAAKKEKPDLMVITGTVTDDKKNPLPNVNVLLKGTGIGTSTNSKGIYTIRVPDGNGTLIFNFVGFLTREIAINGRTSIDLALTEQPIKVNEVVVIGYGTRKKETLTGAVSSVTGEQLKSNPAPNLSNSIAGRVPGVIAVNNSGQPGIDGSSLYIRGFGTLGDNSPLIVIDGVANRGGLERLSPNDIESFTVLKDASAAIYGAQAANGVIIITTKKGKQGKPTIDYSFNQGWSQPTKKLELADAYEYASYRNEYFSNKGQPVEFTATQLEKMKTGADPDNNLANTDWWKATVRDFTPVQRHNLSIKGGGEKVNYYLSGTYLDQDGVFKNSAAKYNQFGYRSKINANVTENFSAGLNLYGQYDQTLSPNAASQRDTWLSLVKAAPYYPAYYSNGYPWTGTENGWNPAVTGTDIGGVNKVKGNLTQNTLNFEWKLPFIQGLSVDGFVAFDKYANTGRSLAQPYSLYSYNNGNYELKQVSRTKDVQLSLTTLESTSVTLNGKINYARKFGNHGITAFVAYEQNEYNSSSFNAFRNNLLTATNAELFLGSNDGKDNNSSSVQTARQNYFGRVSYDYNSKYLVDFTLRYDGSQNFRSDKRFGLFPGVSAAWRVTEESFMKPYANLISNLKLRGSLGKLGNDRIPSFQYLTTYNINASSYIFRGENLVPGISSGTTPNGNITWEVATNSNIGLDAGFLKNMFELQVDVFKSKRRNILAQRNLSVPDYTGLRLPQENIGHVDNKGIELVLTHNYHIGDFNYRISGNYSYAQNKIINIDEAKGAPEYQLRTGRKIDADLYFPTDGLYKSQHEVDQAKAIYGTSVKPGDIKFVDTNNDGKIDGSDRIRLDKSINFPEMMYGFNLGGSYKSFDFSLLFQGAGHIYKYLNTFDAGIRGNYLKPFFTDRWTVDNQSGNWPRADESPRPDNNTQDNRITFYLKNAAYLRLKTAEIGYTLPRAWLKRAQINTLRLYANGTNLLFIYNKLKYTDPEASDDRFGYYPQQRIINLGAVISF